MSKPSQKRLSEADTSFRSSTYSTSWMSMRSMYSVSKRSKDSETLRVTRGPVKSAGCPGPYFPTCCSTELQSESGADHPSSLASVTEIVSRRSMRHFEPPLSICSKMASAEA